MATETRYENPRMDTNWSGGKAYSWLCSGRYYSAEDWTAEVVFKRKNKPLRIGDAVKLNDARIFASLRGKIAAVSGDWAWVTWNNGSSKTYPETIALSNLVLADD